MGVLLDVIDYEEASMPRENVYLEECVKDIHKVINSILNDIVNNTYAFIQLKPDITEWRNKDKLFNLGIIDRESHH